MTLPRTCLWPTSEEVSQILADQADELSVELGRILTEALGGDSPHARRTALFHTIRGFVAGHQLADTLSAGRMPGDEAEAARIFLANVIAAEEQAQQLAADA